MTGTESFLNVLGLDKAKFHMSVLDLEVGLDYPNHDNISEFCVKFEKEYFVLPYSKAWFPYNRNCRESVGDASVMVLPKDNRVQVFPLAKTMAN